jgi:hypothetical protein
MRLRPAAADHDRPGRAPVESSERAGTVTLRFEGRKRPKVVHLFDPRGADTLEPARRRELRYLEHASSMLYVLDPFSIPGLRAAIRHAPDVDFTPGEHATDDPVDAFDSVISSLRSFGGGLSSGVIAVAVVKKDLLDQVSTDHLDTSSEAVRRWISQHGAGGLTWAVEHDFRRHRYFLVSAGDPAAAGEPVRWLLRAEGVRLPPEGRKGTPTEGTA